VDTYVDTYLFSTLAAEMRWQGRSGTSYRLSKPDIVCSDCYFVDEEPED
jgi:hypothetical protein